MHKKTISRCLAGLLLIPGFGFADEIEPNFQAGYRMGFFMAVAAGHPEKVCGNVHFVSMNEVIKKYVSSHVANYPLKYDEVLDLQAKHFPCEKPPAIKEESSAADK